MIPLRRIIIIGLAASMLSLPASAQGKKNLRMVDDGGAGSYRAVVYDSPTTPACTIFAPVDMKSAVAKTTLPVVMFITGESPVSFYERFLSEIASFGFIIVASDSVDAAGVAESVNALPDLVDKSSCCLMTTVDSLLFDNLPPVKCQICINCVPLKSDIPLLYLVGGLDQETLLSTQGSFNSPSDRFEAFAVYPAGKEGTFASQFGGSYSTIAMQWLDWLLKDKPWARKIFTGEECICAYLGWGLEKKNEYLVIINN